MKVGSPPQTVLQAYRYLDTSQPIAFNQNEHIKYTCRNHSEQHCPMSTSCQAVLLLYPTQVLQLGLGHLGRGRSRRGTVLNINH
jgi:hypothetical protein